MSTTRMKARARRHKRVRKHIFGSSQRPRLAVFSSNKHIYAQLIDDNGGKTLVAASTLDASLRSQQKRPTEAATTVGKLIAERAKERGVTSVVFDRGGFLFHGRVKALADAAREAGLEF